MVHACIRQLNIFRKTPEIPRKSALKLKFLFEIRLAKLKQIILHILGINGKEKLVKL